MKLLVTGSNGFIGSALCAKAAQRGHAVLGAVRSHAVAAGAIDVVAVGDVDGRTDWRTALREIDAVIHLAARVHVMKESARDPRSEFWKVNVEGTENLARQAAEAGVKRLVYVSSIKVNGEEPANGHAYRETDTPAPQGPYACSKWEAEQALQRIASETGLEVVIVRPPLVYGPGVKGNFFRLLQAVNKSIPLPLAKGGNIRNMLYVENMADILLTCAMHPAAAGRTYLMRDGEDMSMTQLANTLGEVMGKRVRQFSFPAGLLRRVASAIGQQTALDRLTGSLCIDDTAIRQELGWEPRFTMRRGLQASAEWYIEQCERPLEPAFPQRYVEGEAQPSVSVVIVNYNAGDILRECVSHALQQAEQVVVIDNASSDGSIAALGGIRANLAIVENERNLGFAKACNQGAKMAEGRYILFLNPDCLLESGAIHKLVEALQTAPDIGMVGGLLTNPDGSEQGGARRAVPTPWRSLVRVSGLSRLGHRYPRLFSDFALHKQPLPENQIEVEAISGACMLVRREALEQVGLLDEGYFMHCEDLDWCMRFRRKGWKLLFVPSARMVHHKGHCSKGRPVFVEWNKHKGMVRFYNKFFRHQYPGLLMVFVTIGVWARFASLAGYHTLNHLLRGLGVKRD